MLADQLPALPYVSVLLVPRDLRQPQPVRIVREAQIQTGSAVDGRGQLSAVRPAELRPVIPYCRVADGVVADRVTVVRCQQILPAAVSVGEAVSVGPVALREDVSRPVIAVD